MGDRRSSQFGTASPSIRRNNAASTTNVTQVEAEAEAGAGTTQLVKAPEIQTVSVATQTPDTVPAPLNYEFIPTPPPAAEVLSYSKAIQTSDLGSPPRRKQSPSRSQDSDSDHSLSFSRSPRKLKRRSRREREREEVLRHNLRREIEEELKAAQKPVSDVATAEAKYPARSLTNEELAAVTASDDFLDFVERSSKVIERALDQDYDVLADYSLDGVGAVDSDEDDAYGRAKGKKGRRIRQIAQFYDERWSKKRMISDIDFSSRVYPTKPTVSALLMPYVVSRAATGIVHQEPLRSNGSCGSASSLEPTSAFTPRVHLSCYLRSPHSTILTLPSISPHRRLV